MILLKSKLKTLESNVFGLIIDFDWKNLETKAKVLESNDHIRESKIKRLLWVEIKSQMSHYLKQVFCLVVKSVESNAIVVDFGLGFTVKCLMLMSNQNRNRNWFRFVLTWYRSNQYQDIDFGVSDFDSTDWYFASGIKLKLKHTLSSDVGC